MHHSRPAWRDIRESIISGNKDGFRPKDCRNDDNAMVKIIIIPEEQQAANWRLVVNLYL